MANNYSIAVSANTSNFVKEIKAVAQSLSVDIKVTVDSSALKTYQTSMNNAYTASAKLTKQQLENATAEAKLEQQISKSTIAQEKAKQAILKTDTATQKASASTKTLGQDFLDTAGKVAKFGAITAILGLVTTAIRSAWEEVQNLDSSITELRKVTDLGGESLQAYKDDAYDLANALSTSATNITDAVTEFAKSGYDIADSLELADTAIVFQTIADGAVTASDSATFLIQVMKAYNMTAEESIDIVDKINEVSNNYAISSSDLSDNLGKVASTAALAGINFDELLGLILGLVKPI